MQLYSLAVDLSTSFSQLHACFGDIMLICCSSPLYTQLGVLTKGTILEVNVSEMGLTYGTFHILYLCYGETDRQCVGPLPVRLCGEDGHK